MSHLRLSGRPSVLRGKNFNVGYYTQTGQPIVFIPAMHIGAIDFNRAIPFHWPWPCLGVTRSAQSKTFWLHFLAHFSSDEDEVWCGDEAIWAEHSDTVLTKIYRNKGNSCCFTGCIKKTLALTCIQTFTSQVDSNWILWDAIVHYIFILVKVTGVRKSKHFCAN